MHTHNTILLRDCKDGETEDEYKTTLGAHGPPPSFLRVLEFTHGTSDEQDELLVLLESIIASSPSPLVHDTAAYPTTNNTNTPNINDDTNTPRYAKHPYSGIVFTSATAIHTCALVLTQRRQHPLSDEEWSRLFSTPVFVVGEGTLRASQDFGFQRCYKSPCSIGNAVALGEYIRDVFEYNTRTTTAHPDTCVSHNGNSNSPPQPYPSLDPTKPLLLLLSKIRHMTLPNALQRYGVPFIERLVYGTTSRKDIWDDWLRVIHSSPSLPPPSPSPPPSSFPMSIPTGICNGTHAPASPTAPHVHYYVYFSPSGVRCMLSHMTRLLLSAYETLDHIRGGGGRGRDPPHEPNEASSSLALPPPPQQCHIISMLHHLQFARHIPIGTTTSTALQQCKAELDSLLLSIKPTLTPLSTTKSSHDNDNDNDNGNNDNDNGNNDNDNGNDDNAGNNLHHHHDTLSLHALLSAFSFPIAEPCCEPTPHGVVSRIVSDIQAIHKTPSPPS